MSRLFLIPTPLDPNGNPAAVLPQPVLEIACGLKLFVAEEVRTIRRFLSAYGLKGHIDELEFHELNEHTTPAEVSELLKLFEKGDVGLMSEAGLPAVADPGAALVALCQDRGIEVVPLVGPSSLMMALMGSGLNGQSFAFAGYVPSKPDERKAALRNLEKQSRTLNQSQILIETPYRSDALFQDMLSTLSPECRLCVAIDITMETQTILTKTVSAWRKSGGFVIGKRPCVFVFLTPGNCPATSGHPRR